MLILLLVSIILILYAVLIFNNIIRLKVRVRNAWADIDTQLKRRYDLVPNIVETVRGYAGHEKSVLENVVKARSTALDAHSVADTSKTQNKLLSSLKTLFAVSENYPELRANLNFLEMQKTIVEIENTIQYARRYYNAVVRDYNTRLELFPNILIARAFGFKKGDFFQLESEEEAKNVEAKI